MHACLTYVVTRNNVRFTTVYQQIISTSIILHKLSKYGTKIAYDCKE